MMRRRFIGLWLAAVTAATMAFVVHLQMRFSNVRLGYEVSALETEQRRLVEMQRTLSIEAQTLRNAERVEGVARRVLHMEVPEPSRVVPMGQAAGHGSRRTSGRVR
jgi:cell division protein FtsL